MNIMVLVKMSPSGQRNSTSAVMVVCGVQQRLSVQTPQNFGLYRLVLEQPESSKRIPCWAFGVRTHFLPFLISFSSWLLQGRTMQILVCRSSWQCWLSLVMRDEMAMPQVAEHSLHSVVWTMQLSRGLSAGRPCGAMCRKTGIGSEDGRG